MSDCRKVASEHLDRSGTSFNARDILPSLQMLEDGNVASFEQPSADGLEKFRQQVAHGRLDVHRLDEPGYRQTLLWRVFESFHPVGGLIGSPRPGKARGP